MRSRAVSPRTAPHLADDLERLVALHDASNIAAVIVEPIAGSTGVLIPPQGYLQRLREICDKHGILLIFDEVITGFGRTGSPFAANEFGVTPDSSPPQRGSPTAVRPWVRCWWRRRSTRHSCRVRTTPSSCSTATPTARIRLPAPAGLATLGIYERDGLLTRAKSLARYWEDAAHALRGMPHVIDVRNYGLILGLELQSIPGKVGARAGDVFLKCFERGLLVRYTGDVVALSPPLIIERQHIDQIFTTLTEVLRTL